MRIRNSNRNRDNTTPTTTTTTTTLTTLTTTNNNNDNKNNVYCAYHDYHYEMVILRYIIITTIFTIIFIRANMCNCIHVMIHLYNM